MFPHSAVPWEALVHWPIVLVASSAVWGVGGEFQRRLISVKVADSYDPKHCAILMHEATVLAANGQTIPLIWRLAGNKWMSMCQPLTNWQQKTSLRPSASFWRALHPLQLLETLLTSQDMRRLRHASNDLCRCLDLHKTVTALLWGRYLQSMQARKCSCRQPCCFCLFKEAKNGSDEVSFLANLAILSKQVARPLSPLPLRSCHDHSSHCIVHAVHWYACDMWYSLWCRTWSISYLNTARYSTPMTKALSHLEDIQTRCHGS